MIRIGIVGCGRILAAHLRGYQGLRAAGVEGFRIVALCARRAEDALCYVRRGQGPPQRPPVSRQPQDPLATGDVYLSDFQPGTDTKVFVDYREMINSGLIDAVNDLTSHEMHHQVAEAALAAGLHLLTQKPLAISVAAGRRMCQVAAERGVTFGVFENARFRPDTRRLRWLFDSGRIGACKMFFMANIGNWWAPDQIVAGTPWRHQRYKGGGLSLDMGVHMMHHLRYVLGEIEYVSAIASVQEQRRHSRNALGAIAECVSCDADDTFLAALTMRDGTIGQVAASWSGRGEAWVSGPGRGMRYYAEQGGVAGDTIAWDDGSTEKLSDLYERYCPSSEKRGHFPHGLSDPFALNQHDWLQAIEQRRFPETGGEEGLYDLAAAMAILESNALHHSVRVQDVLRGDVCCYQRSLNQHWGIE